MGKPLVYIDSCCFIEVVKQGRTDSTAAEERERGYCVSLLESARAGEIEVFTSMVAVVECVAAEKGQAKVPQEVRDHFIQMLTAPSSGIMLVEVGIFVIDRARDLRWEDGIVLRSIDSIHVATALDRKCEELVTTDGRLLKRGKEIREKLKLRLVKPSGTQCLPDSRKQEPFRFKPRAS